MENEMGAKYHDRQIHLARRGRTLDSGRSLRGYTERRIGKMDMDKSPELSGQREPLQITGREPVLTGHNARVLADRRGAYLAGNLGALLDMMTPEQQIRFKQWRVKRAVRKARLILHLFEDTYPDDNRPRAAIEAAEAWLKDPTEENQRAARVVGYAVRALSAALSAASEAPWVVWAAASAAYGAASEAGASWVSPVGASWATWPKSAASKRAQLRVAYIILQRG